VVEAAAQPGWIVVLQWTDGSPCPVSSLRRRPMMSGFKQFVLRGNVVDMSVGVVVGGAFAAVVAALTISADATDRSTRG
jgi:hypothetical protein